MFKLQKGYEEYVTKTFRLLKEFVEQLEKVAKKEKRTVKDHIACTVVILVSLLIAAFIFYLTFFI